MNLINAHRSRDYRVLAQDLSQALLISEKQIIGYICRDVMFLAHESQPDRSRSLKIRRVVYPRETPGGWHIIGRMPGRIVSLSEHSIDAKLSIGMTVRCKSISVEEFSQIEASNASD